MVLADMLDQVVDMADQVLQRRVARRAGRPGG